MHVAKLLVVSHLQGVQAAWQPHHNDLHCHGRDLVTPAGAYLSAEELLRTRVARAGDVATASDEEGRPAA